MISNRQWMAFCLAGFCWSSIAFAQQGAGATGGSGSSGAGSGSAAGSGTGSANSGAPDSGAKGSDATPSGTTPSGTKGTSGTSGTTKPSGTKPTDPTAPIPTEPTTPDGATTPGTTPKPRETFDPFAPSKPAEKPGAGESSTFGTPRNPKLEPTEVKPKPADATGESAPSGESSAFGAGSGTAKPQAAPPSYSLPGFFGGPAINFTGGQGRLARPRFRFKVTTSQGYDDNVLQTPDDPRRIPDQQVLVDPGTPDTVTFVPVTTTTYEQAFAAGGLIYTRPVTTTTIERVVTPGRDPTIRTIRSPEPQERFGSLLSRAGLQLDFQKFTRRSLLTLDLNGQVDHYWKRPGTDGKDDYSGTFALNYSYNITPRLSASAALNAAYITQPDISRINTPDRLGTGPLVNGLARLNLSYRLTPRLSATLSVGQNAVIYTEKNTNSTTGLSNNGDNYQTTFSAEVRYLWKPRYTLLAEFRHVLINYPDTPTVNSTSDVLLLGVEAKLSSRLTATLRLGQSVRVFDESGDSSTAPYGEASLAYRLGPTSSVQWNSRFGFEEPSDAQSQVIAYRTTLSYFKAFTPKLSLSAGITGVSTNTTSDLPGRDATQQTLDANVGLQYRLNRQVTLTASFSFTAVVASIENQDYDRSRIFVGAEYEF